MADQFSLDSTGTVLTCNFDGALDSLTDIYGSPLGPDTNTTSIDIPATDSNGNPWTVESATADSSIAAEIASKRAVWVAATRASFSAGIQD